MQSPPVQSSAHGGGFGGLDDAFSSLNFSSTASPPPTASQPQSKPNPFANFDQPASQRSTAAAPQATASAIKGGGFFNPVSTAAPKASTTSNPPAKAPQIPLNNILSPGLGDFGVNSSALSIPQSKPISTSNVSLFDFTETTQQDTLPNAASTASPSINSAFNLSSLAQTSQGPPKAAASATTQQNAFSSLSNADPWGSSDAWATPEPSSKMTSTTKPAGKAPPIANTMDFSSWGGGASSSFSNSNISGPGHGGGSGGNSNIRAAPKVAEDEDFGGWASALPAPTPSSTVNHPKPGPYNTSEDLFSNVWE